MLAVAVAVVELLQVASMLLVLPVIGLVVEPELLHRSALLTRLSATLGAPPLDRLVVILGIIALIANAAAHFSSFAVLAAIEVFTARTQTRFAHALVDDCVAAPYPWFLERNSAVLVRLFHSDIALWGREFVGNAIRTVAHSLTIFMGALLVLTTAPLAGWLLLGVVALVALAVLRIVRPHLLRWTTRKRDAADRTMVLETQIFSGIKDIKVNGGQGYFTGAFAAVYGLMSQASARGVILAQTPAAVLSMLGQMGLLLVVLALWLSGSGGGVLASQMALIALVTYRVVPAVTALSATITQLLNATPWVTGILELRRSLAEARSRDGGVHAGITVPPTWKTIDLRDVAFRYADTDRDVVDGVSLRLERGGAYAIVGPSGSGKSTVIDIILGLLCATRGDVMIDDIPMSAVDLRAWQRRVGYVPQTPYFTDDSIAANVAFGIAPAAIDRDRVLQSLALSGLQELVESLPAGIATRLGERGVKISGGERQRIALARALYRRPELLVLDEATSALDASSQQAVLRAIQALRGHVTTLTVSHQATAIDFCDRVFVLNKGQLTAAGRFCDVVGAAG